MPEWAEVEIMARQLHRQLAGQSVEKVVFHRKDIRTPFSPALKKKLRTASCIELVSRVGKQLMFQFDSGLVYVSLGMTGHFSVLSKQDDLKNHEHVSIYYGGNLRLAYTDPRRFGFWTEDPPPVAPDASDAQAVANRLQDLKRKGVKRSLRDTLMDQRCVGGAGNIYVAEALHRAALHPFRPLMSCTNQQLKTLAIQLALVVKQALELGGSSISSYKDLNGQSGAAQKKHMVYGRDGEPCLKKGCNGLVLCTRKGGRGIWHCPLCQT